MSDPTNTAAERAAARRSDPSQWPVRRYALGEEPVLDPLDTSTAEQRLERLARLSERAWALTGKPLPTYTRAEMPGVVRRPPL